MAKRCDTLANNNSLVTSLVAEHAIAHMNFGKEATINIRAAIAKCRSRRRSLRERRALSLFRTSFPVAAPDTHARNHALAHLLKSSKAGNASYMKVLRMVYDTSITSINPLSSKYGMSSTQVRKHLEISACVGAKAMYDIANLIIAMSQVVRFSLIVDSCMLDETKQRVTIRLAESLLRSQSSSAPHVLLVLRHFFGIIKGNADFLIMLPWHAPPTACLTTTASTLYSVSKEMPGIASQPAFSDFFQRWSHLQIGSSVCVP